MRVDDMVVHVEADTGGVRKRLLAMDGMVVDVEAPPPPAGHRFSVRDWRTVTAVAAA